MSIFRRDAPSPDLTEPLAALTERVAALESKSKLIQLEWDETFDKIRRLTSRLAKRDAVDAKPTNGPDDPTDEPQVPDVDPISAQILARRARGRPRQ